jgi:hypothetical protein
MDTGDSNMFITLIGHIICKLKEKKLYDNVNSYYMSALLEFFFWIIILQ